MSQYGTYFTFDDIKSNDYDVWISGTGVFDAPSRDITTIAIPGKSGDLILDNGRYNNIEITYPCYIPRNFITRFNTFKAAMLSKTGKYFVLRDTYDANTFRMASFNGGITPTTGIYNQSGSFEITFNCKPQRYTNAGMITSTLTTGGIITNNTLFTARPLLRVYGYGRLTVGADYVTIAQHTFPYIDLDCEAMDAYYQSTNANSYITLSGDTFPVFAPGQTTINKASTITRIEFTPRWWTL